MGECSNVEVIEELKKFIREQVGGLRSEIKEYITSKLDVLNSNLERFEEENRNLARRVHLLEQRHRKNNLVVFGLEEGSDPVAEAVTLIRDRLGFDLSDNNINNAVRIGRKDNAGSGGKSRPLLIELVTFRCKQAIFKEKSKLKGTGIFISRDQSREEREKARLLTAHLKAARGQGYFAKVRNNQVQIGSESFTVEQLERSADDSAGDAKHCDGGKPSHANMGPSVGISVHNPRQCSNITSDYRVTGNPSDPNKAEVAEQGENQVRVANAVELDVASNSTSTPRMVGELPVVPTVVINRKDDVSERRLRSNSGSKK